MNSKTQTSNDTGPTMVIEDKNKIENWMTSELIKFSPQESFLSVVNKMWQNRIGAVLIIEDEKLIGIFSERDVLKILSTNDLDQLSNPIKNYMTQDPICVAHDDEYNSVYLKMKINNIRHVPVLKDERLVGIVSIRDLLSYYQNSIETQLIETIKHVEKLESVAGLSGDNQVVELMSRVRDLEELSLTDALTGLYNNRYFKKRLVEETHRAQRYKSVITLIFCDIDFFKKINDTYGHQVGDQILKKIGDILNIEIDSISIVSRLRKSDIVARYGGEEFVMLLPETGLDGGFIAAERIRKIIEKQNFEDGKGNKFKVTISFGVAELPKNASNEKELIASADKAMYNAKAKGRNRVEIAPEISTEI